ncbi:ParB N-terminal domain-containing protein [Parvibacter caecicola]|uniref:ParB N-terminal domain-containing protein n=1 Tax=Parvibacter caecicola TaxID=747645 RepID=UPI001F406C87|nr:ParB N-terminal domain-containing protein [Parvibacter caecicola]
MARKRVPIDIPTADELFTSQSERDSGSRDGIAEIQLALMDPFPGHPFHVKDDEGMERLAESIAENGVLVPLTVRASGAERYELVSGRRRKRAAGTGGA